MIDHVRTQRLLRLITIATVLVLIAAACGGDDDGAVDPATDADGTTETDTGTEGDAETDGDAESDAETDGDADGDGTADTEGDAAEGTPILIAGIIDETGSTPVGPGSRAAVEAWAEHVNAGGGIEGHPVVLELRDAKGDGAAAQATVEELLAMDPVLFLLSAPTTETAVSETLAAAELPVMGVGYNPSVWGGFIDAMAMQCSLEADAQFRCGIPNAFAVTTTFGAVVDQQVLGAQAAGATKLGAAACAEVDSCAASEPIRTTKAAQLGIETVPVVRVSSTATDYSAECIQWIQNDVDFIQIAGSAVMGVNLIASCADQGYDGIWGASAGSVNGDLIKVEGVTLAGGLHGFPWWVDDPAVQEYRDAMAAIGADETAINDPSATGMWSALELFATAQSAGLSEDPTGAETLANMFTIENETLGGLISPMTITEDLTTRARNCFWPYSLRDGEFTNPLGGLQYQCSPEEG